MSIPKQSPCLHLIYYSYKDLSSSLHETNVNLVSSGQVSNLGPQADSGLLVVFINKVLLEYGLHIHL